VGAVPTADSAAPGSPRHDRSERNNPSVAVTAHTRKVLWSLSGNACARCNAALVEAPEALGDMHAIVGRECHIIAQAPAGPRGDAGPREGLDDYENLILLCANCHACIDSQPELFPPQTLRRIKTEHEQRIARPSAPWPPDIRLRGRNRRLRLELMRCGDALLDLLGPSFSFAYERPDRLSSSQRELLGSFLQSCQDWGDIYSEIGPKGHLDAGQDLQDGLDALRNEGLLVYAAQRPLTLTGGDQESRWPEAVVKVVHERDALVIADAPVVAAP
jgi:hypothetical protein